MKGRFAFQSLCWPMLTVWILLVTLAAVARPAAATNNIIVFVADDLGWNDLPYFSEPADWATFPSGSSWDYADGEVRRVDASFNRFAARTYSTPSGSAATLGWRLNDAGKWVQVKAVDWQHPSGSAPTQYEARAVCSGTGCAGGTTDCGNTTGPAQATCAQARQDVIEGFGGLRRLAQSGIVFPRFYANSSKCGPSRAALMTGKYPRRTGVTLNGGQLDAEEVTIAEYLKQGCSVPASEEAEGTPIEKQCRNGGKPATSHCGCFVKYAPSGNTPCAEADPALPCYRTGLVGKYHLGAKNERAVWNQGFDEYFGFGGGSRHYWNTDDLQCSPAPNYCDGGQSNANREMCTGSCSSGDCVPRGLYVGTRRGTTTDGQASFNPCEDNVHKNDPDCCSVGKGGGTGRGAYAVLRHLAADPAEGKDNWRQGYRPCSDPGQTKDANCAYLTRVLRDQARNFIVRNVPQEPFFLVVSFHAPHRGFAAPLRTEDHHKTYVKPNTSDPAREEQPKEPGSATKYWGIIEEMDAAVGQVLELLERKGVCEEDPSVSCTGSSSGCTCLDMGRTSSGALCHDSGSGCSPLKDRTAVFFFSDHGRAGDRGYGAPALRGGKGDVYEGGVRAGMLAYYPGQTKGMCASVSPPKPCDPDASTSDCAQGEGDCVGPHVCANTLPLEACDPDATPNTCPSSKPCVPLELRAPVMASIVDLFPTVAEIAGLGSYMTEGQSWLKVNSSGQAIKKTDGRSFLWALENPAAPPSHARKRVFASYPSDGMTVVTTESDLVNNGTYAVCAYDSKLDGNWSDTMPRRILGGSCVKPSEQVPCDTAHATNGPWCKLPGRVCLGTNPPTGGCGGKACLDKNWYHPTGSADKHLYRCKQSNSECPASLKCTADVWIQCNTQVDETLWKLRTKQPPASPPATHDKNRLFELKSNPSEDDDLNCHFAYESSSQVNYQRALFNDLYGTTSGGSGLARWDYCNSTTNQDCADGPP
jgi:arylsulfatase A-like enzyme